MDAARDQWMRRLGPFYPLLVAFQSQTELPIASDLDPDAEDLARAAPWIIAVGIGLGLALALVATILLWTPLVPAIIATLLVTLEAFATGALAERGLVRVALGWLGASTPASVGSGHLLGAVLVRLGLLLGTATDSWTDALVVSAVVGRLAFLIHTRPPWDLLTNDPPSEEPMAAGLRLGGWGIIFAAALAACIAFSGGWGVLAIAFSLGLGWLGRRGAFDRGSVVGLAELVALVIVAASSPAVVSPLVAR